MKVKLLILVLFIVIPQYLYCSEFIIDNVPFFPSKKYNCGPSSLAMVLNFYGLKVSPEEIANEIYSENAKGTWDFDMIRYVLQKGFKAKHYQGSIDDIREKIMQKKPLIVMTDEGFWFYKKYHFMVVVGFNDNSIIVNSETKEHKTIDIEDFLKKWQKTDFWTLLIEQ